MTEETFKKELIRMWDSAREKEDYKGAANCVGVDCKRCMLDCWCREGTDQLIYNFFAITEKIEQWSKEHPVKTNKDAAKELLEKTFGVKLSDSFMDILDECRGIDRANNCVSCSEGKSCSDCKYLKFWEQEYKGEVR